MFVSAALALLALAGCGGTSPPDEFTMSKAWARPTPTLADTGAVYVTVIADVDDSIVGATVGDDVADQVTLHATTVGGGDGDAGGGDLVSMSSTPAIELEAGKPFEFVPGGNHIMLEGLAQPLTVGSRFTLTLQLASGRSPSIDVVVSDNPPS